jgi:hypothetical protein
MISNQNNAGAGAEHTASMADEVISSAGKRQSRSASLTETAKKEGRKAAKNPRYAVAPGRSLSCTQGIVDAGQPITAADFVRHKDRDEAIGQSRLDEFVAKGYVVKL